MLSPDSANALSGLARRRGVIVGYVAGEAKEPPLRPTFDRRIKLEFHGAKITSDGGLLAYRELDEALGLTDMAITKLLDGRSGKNTRHKLSGLFRQAVLGRLAGYEDINDAERLAHDPAMRAIVGREGFDRGACPAPGSTGCMHVSRRTASFSNRPVRR